MIELDFELEADAKGPGGPYPDLWVDEIQLGSFEGLQTCVVNDLDLSGPLPILGFARNLRVIANLLAKIRIGEQDYYDLSSEWVIKFRADGENVEISDIRGRSSISLDEFQEAARKYAERVYTVCHRISPDILDSEFVQAWWNNDDWFPELFEPKSTDRSSLTPKHPFYEGPK